MGKSKRQQKEIEMDKENNGIITEVKEAIIEQEMTLWGNSLYQLQLRYRVNKKIGSAEVILKQIEDEMLKCEAALDILKEELEGVKA